MYIFNVCFLVFHIKISFGSSFALQTTFFFIILVEGESFQLFIHCSSKTKKHIASSFVAIAENSDFFATFLWKFNPWYFKPDDEWSRKETSLQFLTLYSLIGLFFPQVSFVSSFSIVSCWVYWQDHWNKTKRPWITTSTTEDTDATTMKKGQHTIVHYKSMS